MIDNRDETPIRVLPITPAQAKKEKISDIPSLVFKVFNSLIIRNIVNVIGSKVEATFSQDEVVDQILLETTVPLTREMIFERGWLNVEPIYRKYGWKVEYDKPGFNETYATTFTFTSKR